MKKIGFTKIEIDYLEGESLSVSGVPLQINGRIIKENVNSNVLISILMTRNKRGENLKVLDLDMDYFMETIT